LADNITISGGIVATDDISGVHVQRVKATWGADGTATDVSAAAPLPTGQTAVAGTNGLTSSRVVAAASTNATSLKATPGRIARMDLFNTSASIRYFKLYNKASAPTVGTDTPVLTIPIAANGQYLANFEFGKYFSTGIAYAITGALADGDTTNVAAGDVTGAIDWV